MSEDEQRLSLTHDEALVLFELLHRWEDDGRVSEPRNKGEQVALWSLTAVLERVVEEVFDPEYDRRVAEATERLSGV